MTWPALSARDRRALRLGALLLVPALLWVFAVGPYLRALDQAETRLEAERSLLLRERDLLVAARAYPEEFEAGAELLLEEAKRLVPGEDVGAAGPHFATYVRRLARIGAVRAKRMELEPPRPAGGGITAIPLRLSGESDLEGVLTLLHLLETGPQLVHVERLRIEGGRSEPAWGAVNADMPEVLSFEMSVSGFTLAAPREPSAEEGESRP
ncbi:MAG TPA: GspMb/PilO family protein [Longimicrobiaceae bacterium]|nr:GspMb/PilO family protein [Longimicrobiaceae bacterium]